MISQLDGKWNPAWLGVAFCLVLFLFATRLANLMALPIFSDEAIYLHLAQKVLRGHPFITLEDMGLRPLYIWLIAVFYPLAKDPLLVARTLSVLAAAVTLTTLQYTAAAFGSIRTAVVAGVLFLLLPYALFFDRLGLFHPLGCALSALALYFACQMIKRGHAHDAILFGMMAGLGLITQRTAWLFLTYPAAMALGAWIAGNPLNKNRIRNLFLGWGFALVVLIFVFAAPLVQYGRGIFHHSPVFFSPVELVRFPWEQWSTNAHAALAIAYRYVGVLPLGLAVGHFVLSLRNRDGLGVGLGLCWIGPAVVVVLASAMFASKSLLFILPPLVLAAAFFLDAATAWLAEKVRIGRRIVFAILLILVLAPTLPLYLQILREPTEARLVQDDRHAYVEGWSSGYGAKKLLDRIEAEAKTNPVTVFITHHDGVMRDVLFVYLWGNPRVAICPSDWMELRPVLEGAAQWQGVAGATEWYHGLLDCSLTSQDGARKPLFLLNSPQFEKERFIELNPDAVGLLSVTRPKGRSFMELFDLTGT